jgi:hypothetical protein
MMPVTPAAAWLVRNEMQAGFRIVRPGQAPWLPLCDWHEDTIASTNQFRVRLVALIARDPGRGAFRRLVEAIQREGMVPVVVEPFNDLAQILTRWKWKHRLIGRGEFVHWVWYPRTPWKGRQ